MRCSASEDGQALLHLGLSGNPQVGSWDLGIPGRSGFAGRSSCGMWDRECGVWDVGYGIWVGMWGIQDTGFGI